MSLTVTNGSDSGSQALNKGQWRREEYTVDLHQKTKIECVIAAGLETIRAAARTHELGDSKIFVLPVQKTVQIRTA